MAIQVISPEIYQDFLQIRAKNQQPTISYDDFVLGLETWYHEFQAGNCSLGYAAAQLGIGQIDFIYLLDSLGWKVTNL